ncbi:galactitol-1-phosphate 5-dehydrogenase [Galbibacter mesophilus]|uniref:galactitol-1-phosphate 5-dehydrogenase n=1 Tax=Galbibacter mesophilus TaxID=379069 RepID=UPI00191E39EA|nr:galactitol-1-phosphate 5-dehydrogenase [Galbibacter mesophilus]MCM5663076.1 galactitol-1-phosphate 5-dehydrogenase [Galbibacter mesophilus]
MKALVLESNGQLKVQKEYPNPTKLNSDYILIKVVACGICGSDLVRGFHNGAYFYPLIMGHEFSGIVAEDKPDSNYKKGDRVAVFPLIPINKNEKAYQTGDYAQLKEYNYLGSRSDGAFSEYVYAPVENLFPVPEHVDSIHASMTEPAAVALHGVRKMHINVGDNAAVIGGGPIGNMTAQWLRIHGCNQVFVIDVDEKKLNLASEMGFHTINAAKENVAEVISEKTQGEGVKKVVEACGLPKTFLQALEIASRSGEVVFMGNIHGTFTMEEKDFSNILRKELTIYGTWNSKTIPTGEDDWSTVLKYMDKELQVAPLISHIISIEEAPKMFNDMVAKNIYYNKVIINPTL